jgi:DNA-binding MarR family transcriptional regulator
VSPKDARSDVTSRPKDETYQLLVADIYELAGALRRHGDELAGAVGQSQARWQVLSVLSDGDWTVPDAARRLGVSRQAVQRIADLLVEEGSAEYEPNPGHKRSPYVRLTRSGAAALASIDEAASTRRSQVLRDVSAADLEHAHSVLRTLLAQVHP